MGQSRKWDGHSLAPCFLSSSKLHAFLEKSDPNNKRHADEPKLCNNFKADEVCRSTCATHCSCFLSAWYDSLDLLSLFLLQVEESKSTNRPVTALASFLCSHSNLLFAFNLHGGERWGYGLFCLSEMASKGYNSVALNYDINCRFGKGAAAFLELLGRTLPCFLPVPGFHAKMHDSACQSLNRGDRFEGIGLGRGEPTEIMNAYLGRAAQRTRYMLDKTRAIFLSVKARLWNDDKLLRFGKLQLVALERTHKIIVSVVALSAAAAAWFHDAVLTYIPPTTYAG